MLLTAVTLDVPHVPPAQRVAVESINAQFHTVKVFFGFMDEPDLPEALEWCAEQGLRLDMMDTSFFLGRETLMPKLGSEMALLAREALRRDVPERGQRRELLPAAAEPRRRARLADRALSARVAGAWSRGRLKYEAVTGAPCREAQMRRKG